MDWWQPETKEKYLERAQCIIDQYGNYSVQLGEETLNLNGINTQGENIADNGGIKEAYISYQSLVSSLGPEPQLPGLPFSPSQLFWLSGASKWCTVSRPRSIKNQVSRTSLSEFYPLTVLIDSDWSPLSVKLQGQRAVLQPGSVLSGLELSCGLSDESSQEVHCLVMTGITEK